MIARLSYVEHHSDNTYTVSFIEKVFDTENSIQMLLEWKRKALEGKVTSMEEVILLREK